MLIKNDQEIQAMREGGRILGNLLKTLAQQAMPGVSTQALNDKAEEMISQAGAQPAFKGYSMSGLPPYPCALCVSINEEVVHGLALPDRVLNEGDIVGLDCGLIYKGMYVDSAVTVAVGRAEPAAKHLIKVTQKALDLGLAQIKNGATTGDIGHAVQTYVESEGLSVIRELVGHGVGHGVHEPPHIPNYGQAGSGAQLCSGMTVAVEPMVAIGGWQVKFAPKDWPVVTKDGSLCAHFEHTVLVTDKGFEILTVR